MTDGLVAALARAQANFPAITKGRTATVPTKSGGQYSYSYADLADVLAAVRPSLNAEGVWLSQPISTSPDGQVLLHTVVEGHGDRLSSTLPLHLDGMTPQQLGSLLTYYRRYMLSALLGVASEDDDDGNAAQTAPTRTLKKDAPQPGLVPPDKPVDEMTVAELIAYAREIGVAVSGSKAEMVRVLTPYAMTAARQEPFELPEQKVSDTATVDNAITDKPFEPHIWNPETGKSEPVNPAAVARKSLSGSERKRLDSASKAE